MRFELTKNARNGKVELFMIEDLDLENAKYFCIPIEEDSLSKNIENINNGFEMIEEEFIEHPKN